MGKTPKTSRYERKPALVFIYAPVESCYDLLGYGLSQAE